MARAHNRVLLVDDEEAVRLSWSRYLAEQDFAVSTAEDGGKAITRLTAEPVDVVVADLRMPGVDGLELLDWMHGRRPGTPFILLTGYGNEEVERRARELGAFDYLSKPIDPEVLAAVITAATVEKERNEAAERRVREAAARAAADTAAGTVTGTAVGAEAGARMEAAAAVEPGARVEPEAVDADGGPKEAAQIVGGLILGPVIGLAFVMFLPLIGFAAFFKVLAEALTGRRPANT